MAKVVPRDRRGGKEEAVGGTGHAEYFVKENPAMTKPHQQNDDPSEAPESGTVTGETSGNNAANPQDRPGTMPPSQHKPNSQPQKSRDSGLRDDPSTAGEER
ncbi:MAG: hypothetical protein K2X38_08535 [Gemmataceae bacterium]|nr:hypothetical protein [Gemmataceae bacterium]